MRKFRLLPVLLLTALCAACDPSAFGPQAHDPRSTAVSYGRVSAELARTGFHLVLPGPDIVKPGSIIRSEKSQMLAVQPPPDTVAVSARPSKFSTLSADILIKPSDLAKMAGPDGSNAESLLVRAGVTDILLNLSGITVRTAGSEFYSNAEALRLISDSYLATLSRAADSEDGSLYLVGEVAECREAEYRLFYGDVTKFREVQAELTTLFRAAGDFEKVGGRQATLKVTSGRPLVAAVQKLHGKGLDAALISRAAFPAYTIRMEGIDDYGYAFVNDIEVLSGVDDDSGETAINTFLKPGENTILFQVVNAKADLAYKISVKAEGRMPGWHWEKSCGLKGQKGCSRQKGMFEEKCVVECDDAMRCRIK